MSPEIVRRAERWGGRVAIACNGERYTYASLLHASASRAEVLGDVRGERVVSLIPPGFDYVAWQWATWRAGAVAVPLSASQAAAEWDYIVEDVRPAVIVGDDARLATIAEQRGVRHVWGDRLDAADRRDACPTTTSDRRDARPTEIGGSRPKSSNREIAKSENPLPALILYTSGTTSRPKGVVLTHANLEAQMTTLVEAWGWQPDDRILHVLPLNHVHGIVNVLGCALWAGACCEFPGPFEAERTWERLSAGDVTLFMAVPTIYAKLLAAFDAADANARARWSAGARRVRLMVSGSAALPVTVLERWRDATGHVLLERYGMTEIGMALSNPLDGRRRPGMVGVPLPGVAVRLVDDHGREVAAGTPGEIEVRGANVFREYWQRPDATRDAFRDGWFRTGDVAVVEEGSYRILGRSSTDIIKTGGYKVSALEIEEVLREHQSIADVAVVGVPDEEWGERVAAAVVPRGDATVALDDLRQWASSRLSKYKLPTRLVQVQSLPRNAMGKVVKGKVRELFE